MNCSRATEFHRKSGQGLGVNSECDLSAVGAALNLGPLAPLSSRAKPTCPGVPWRDLQFCYLLDECPMVKRKPTRKVKGSDG